MVTSPKMKSAGSQITRFMTNPFECRVLQDNDSRAPGVPRAAECRMNTARTRAAQPCKGCATLAPGHKVLAPMSLRLPNRISYYGNTLQIARKSMQIASRIRASARIPLKQSAANHWHFIV